MTLIFIKIKFLLKKQVSLSNRDVCESSLTLVLTIPSLSSILVPCFGTHMVNDNNVVLRNVIVGQLMRMTNVTFLYFSKKT